MQVKSSLVRQLKAKGFDKSCSQNGIIKVRCSQCEAVVIMGVPCHEGGCPNARRGKGNA